MDLKIKVGSALSPVDKQVKFTDTPKEILNEIHVPYRDGEVTLNGRVLGSAEMTQTMRDLCVRDGDYITVNTKQNGGAKR